MSPTALGLTPRQPRLDWLKANGVPALNLARTWCSTFDFVLSDRVAFYELEQPRGITDFFTSHGTSDKVLPIDDTSRVIVPKLRICFAGRRFAPPFRRHATTFA